MKLLKPIIGVSLLAAAVGGITYLISKVKPAVFGKNPKSILVTKKEYSFENLDEPEVKQLVLDSSDKQLLTSIVSILEKGVRQEPITYVYIHPTWILELNIIYENLTEQEVAINFEQLGDVKRFLVHTEEATYVIDEADVVGLLSLIDAEWE